MDARENALEWIAHMREQLGPVPPPKRWKRSGFLSEAELMRIAAAEADLTYEEMGMAK